MAQRFVISTGASNSADSLPAVWPGELVPAQQTLDLVANSTRQVNAFTKALQAAPITDANRLATGARWTLSFSLSNLDEQQYRLARSFVAGLRGQAKRFLFPALPGTVPEPAELNPETGRLQPRVVSATELDADPFESPEVVFFRQAAWSPSSIPTAGWRAQAGEVVLRAGDYLSFDDTAGMRRLCTVTRDAVVGQFGEADVSIEPPLAFYGGELRRIDVRNPSATFVLQSDEEGVFEQNAERAYSAQINAAQVRSLRPALLAIGVKPVPPEPVDPVDPEDPDSGPTFENVFGPLSVQLRYPRNPQFVFSVEQPDDNLAVEVEYSLDGGAWQTLGSAGFYTYQNEVAVSRPTHLGYPLPLPDEPFTEARIRFRAGFYSFEADQYVYLSGWSTPVSLVFPEPEPYSDVADAGGPAAPGELSFSYTFRLFASAAAAEGETDTGAIYEYQFREAGTTEWSPFYGQQAFEGLLELVFTDTEFDFFGVYVGPGPVENGLELRVRTVSTVTGLQSDWTYGTGVFA